MLPRFSDASTEIFENAVVICRKMFEQLYLQEFCWECSRNLPEKCSNRRIYRYLNAICKIWFEVDFLKESRWLYDGPNRTGCRDGVPSLARSIVTDHGEATIHLETLTRTSSDVTLKCHEPRTYIRSWREHFQQTLHKNASHAPCGRGSTQIAASRGVGCGPPASSFFDALSCVSWPRRPTLYNWLSRGSLLFPDQ